MSTDTRTRRACCPSWLGDAHESGCYAPLRALFARARLECRGACLLRDEESSPLDAPRGLVTAEAVRLAHLLDGATYALRQAEGTALWAGVHRSYRTRAVCLVEELRACQAAGRVAA